MLSYSSLLWMIRESKCWAQNAPGSERQHQNTLLCNKLRRLEKKVRRGEGEFYGQILWR